MQFGDTVTTNKKIRSGELTSLAATHAALDPARQSWRSDVLISAVVEILSRKGLSSLRDLQQEVTSTWVTRSVTRAALREALGTAEEAGLVASQRRGSNEHWMATPEAQEDADADRTWVKQLISRLQGDIAERLRSAPGGASVDDSQVARLTNKFVTTIVRAASDANIDAKQSQAVNLSEVRINLRSVIPAMQAGTDSNEAAEALAALVLAAADSEDPFANELMRLVAAGQILHQLLIRKDIAESAHVPTLVVDTSTLVDLLSPELVLRDLAREFLSQGAETRIVVTPHVQEEWEHLWTTAEDEWEELGTSSIALAAAEATEMHQNPVLNGLLGARRDRSETTFEAFANSRRSLRRLLREFDVLWLESYDSYTLDWEFVEELEGDLRAGVESRDGRRRSERTARTDARTAAMVRSVREASPETGLPAAWMIAKDHLTPHIYRTRHPADPFPLAMNSRSWLVYFAAQGEPAQTQRFVEALSDGVLRDAYFAVVTGYTTEDFLELGQVLGPDGALTEDDIDDLVLAQLLQAEPVSSVDRATEFARRRASRRTKRALRSTEEADARSEDAKRAASQAQDDAVSALARASESKTEAETWRRRFHVACVMAVALVGLLVVSFGNWLATGWLIFGWAAILGGGAIEGRRYATDLNVSPVNFVWGAVGSLFYFGLAFGFSQLTDSPPDEPAPTNPKETTTQTPAG